MEIVFGTKDISKEEIEESIKKYTDADFEIAMIEQGVDETRVIIEFIGINRAKEFVRIISDGLSGEKKALARESSLL